MFYLTLPSNSSMDYFPNNTLSHYITRLPHTLDLDGSWEIGLAEIQYPHSWYNVKHEEAWVQVDFYRDSQLQNDHFFLPAGYYTSAKRIVKAIEVKKHRTEYRNKFDIRINDVNNKVSLAVKKDFQVTISPMLQTMLGFKQAIFPEGDYVGDWVADVTRGLTSLYVYCPLVDPRLVGDAQVPLLRIVPVEGKGGQLVTRVFDPIQYFPLVQRRFQTVEINIRDDAGDIVPFERGRVVVTLHCRKRKESYLE